MTTTQDRIAALAPTPAPLEAEWSTLTVDRIVASPQDPRRTPRPWWRRTRRRATALVASGVVVLSAGTAVAGGGPGDVVKDAILSFSKQPDSPGNGLGRLDKPALVGKFRYDRGLFAVWIATSSSGKVCYASTDGSWDGEGTPTRSELEYGCGGMIVSHLGTVEELTRADQFGGFFKDTEVPIIYGVSPMTDAVQVRVRGVGVDRTLALRPRSHGFGAALPSATRARFVTLTFLDDAGRDLGSRRWVAPVG